MANFQHLMSVSDFPADDRHVAEIGGWRIFVMRIDGDYFAINDRCPHAASALSEGRVRRGHVMCPLHGARFDAKTGKCAGGAYADVRTFPVRIVDGAIEIDVPPEPPGPAETPLQF